LAQANLPTVLLQQFDLPALNAKEVFEKIATY